MQVNHTTSLNKDIIQHPVTYSLIQITYNMQIASSSISYYIHIKNINMIKGTQIMVQKPKQLEILQLIQQLANKSEVIQNIWYLKE